MDDLKNRNEVIRHFTSVDALCGILENGFRFSNGVLWTDEDDKYDIERYRQIIKKDVGVLCFCDGLGSIYHWTNLGVNGASGKKIKCYIAIKKENFIEYVSSLGICESPRNVIYCHEAEILSREVTDIPYLKNREYHIENELRFVYVGNDVNKGVYIPNIIPYVKCITISKQDCNIEEYQNIKMVIESHYPMLKGKVIQNLTEWRSKIELLVNK